MIAAIQDETIMALYKIRAQLIQELEEPVDHLEGVPELGGLAILGTERHESRRIDNQLRGRSWASR